MPLYVPSHTTDKKSFIFNAKLKILKIEKIQAGAPSPEGGGERGSQFFFDFLKFQLCIENERFFDSTTPKQYTFKPYRKRPIFITHPVCKK